TPCPVVSSARGKLNAARDEVLDSDGAFEPLDFVIPGGARLLRHCSRLVYSLFLRQGPRGLKQAHKFLPAPAQADEEVRHVAALSYLFGQADNPGARNQPRHAL